MKQLSKKMENRIIELLYKLPGKIEHKILDSWFDDNNDFVRGWTKDKMTLFLEINKRDDNQFVAFYRHLGFEGEVSRLPLRDDEVDEYMEYGSVLQDVKAGDLETVLEELYKWLIKENLISE